MPIVNIDRFNQIKKKVAGLIESLNIVNTYTDRYVETKDSRFAVVYFGEWTEEQSDLEETEVTGNLSIQIFARNDDELSETAARIRPVLKEFEEWQDEHTTLTDFRPVGGEYLPEEAGIRPSMMLNYSVVFIDG